MSKYNQMTVDVGVKLDVATMTAVLSPAQLKALMNGIAMVLAAQGMSKPESEATNGQ